jgi:hypothetical protein
MTEMGVEGHSDRAEVELIRISKNVEFGRIDLVETLLNGS